MNEKFLHITRSLEDNYPAPDIPEDHAWEEMRNLLEEDESKLAPIPPPSGKSRGGNGFWKFGLLLLLITGFFLYTYDSKLKQGQKNNFPENAPVSGQPANHNDESGNKSNSTLPDKTLSVFKKDSTGLHENNGRNITPHPKPFVTKNKKQKAEITMNAKNPVVSSITPRLSGPKKTNKPSNAEGSVAGKNTGRAAADLAVTQSVSAAASQNSPSSNIKPEPAKHAGAAPEQDSLKKKEALVEKHPPVNSGSTEKKKTVPTPASDDEKDSKRIALAAGLGLNQFFTVGNQQHSDYNSGGTVGAISDYIPVPFVRAYLNKKLYIQLEAQINTPQYTKQLLAKTEIVYDTAGPVQTTKESSVYINKLFYFNIPLAVYYSPLNNLYVGAGLQFSRLTNGVGLFEGKQYSSSAADTLSDSKFASMKDDPVYKEIKTNEWRVLLDANYQWQNLVLGVRYNLALSNFINVQVSSTQVTQGRNSSIQLYLRYILWKNKKTKELLSK